MRYHFIAIGGAVMHQLALHLKDEGHQVTGADDSIFDPAKSNLEKHGILPKKLGWFAENITNDIDAIILGMHAKADNPELIEAQKIGLKIYSFPEFIYEKSRNKKRIVIAGSNGKTTTTSMIMHQCKTAGLDFDYLVGSKIEGFEYMVKVSEKAPIIIIEGDEYLTSPLDNRSKFLHFHPHIAVITSIDWDHINVFPTFELYLDTFKKFISSISEYLFYYENDKDLNTLVSASETSAKKVKYQTLPYSSENNESFVTFQGKKYVSSVFGNHNFSNWSAALKVCKEIGIEEVDFYKSMFSFSGAAKRLEKIYEDKINNITIFRDFAHAPAKLKATVNAVRDNYKNHHIIAVYELHTFSSTQEDFIPQYNNSMEQANITAIFMDESSFKLKEKTLFDINWLADNFGSPRPQIITQMTDLDSFLVSNINKNTIFLLMSSGHLGGWNAKLLKQAISQFT